MNEFSHCFIHCRYYLLSCSHPHFGLYFCMLQSLLIAKYRWPECKSMSAVACKELIDNDIMTLNTDVHTTIRSVIIEKRNETQKWYNAVAIPIWSNGWAAGRNGDGLIQYDFQWLSSGEPVSSHIHKTTFYFAYAYTHLLLFSPSGYSRWR